MHVVEDSFAFIVITKYEICMRINWIPFSISTRQLVDISVLISQMAPSPALAVSCILCGAVPTIQFLNAYA